MEKIQSQLIKPFVEKMEKEWQALYDKISQEKSQESEKLRPEVETHLVQIKKILKSGGVPQDLQISGEEGMHDFVRQSKMSLRTAERRWQRHLVSTERVKTRALNHSAKFPGSSPSTKN